MNWQPIETAPKDGTWIDLWIPSRGRAPDCWWHVNDEDRGCWVQRYAETVDNSFEIEGEPTHWIKIPKPDYCHDPKP